ncbi:MAG: hypothetical protein JRN68_05145 [Nitrososphaerota archaeon]|nr:hypothetical protein [Nitrososphaerota archaeon]
MAADGEEVLMAPEKETDGGPSRAGKDLRGSQVRIGRLRRFYLEAFVHMLFNRILAPFSVLFGVLFLAWFALFPSAVTLAKALLVILWILFTPQFLETVKGLSLASSRGIAFGHLNPEFAYLYKSRYHKGSAGYRVLLAVVAAIWLASLVILVVAWSP